ncbi:MAG: YccF domain-containing protein [Clostridiales bacterium]|nr:YccF domain-containing protein [Clostridiales bacterium]
MRVIGNIFWFIFIGLLSAIGWTISGILLCITIIGIPFGKQCFKIAWAVMFPFGKEIRTNFEKHSIGNILWIIFFGWELALSYIVAGVVFCITIIGIPFGKQCFKLVKLAIAPMGASVVKVNKK